MQNKTKSNKGQKNKYKLVAAELVGLVHGLIVSKRPPIQLTEIAKKSGLNYSFLSRLIRSGETIKLSTLVAILDAIDYRLSLTPKDENPKTESK